MNTFNHLILTNKGTIIILCQNNFYIFFLGYCLISKPNNILTHSIATLGPTWEFQPCLKSCNLASWTTKWHDYAMGTGHPPRPSWKWNLHIIQVWRVPKRCLEGVWWASARYRGCLEGTKKVFENFQNILGPKIFWGPNSLESNYLTQDILNQKFMDPILLLTQIFWIQYFHGHGNFWIQ